MVVVVFVQYKKVLLNSVFTCIFRKIHKVLEYLFHGFFSLLV